METRARDMGYLLLRLAMGMIFFIYGLEKFLGGRQNVAASKVSEFAKTPLSPWAVRSFAEVLPFFEVLFGALLLLGIFTVEIAFVTGLLLLALTFGMLWLGNGDVVANNTVYLIAVFLLLYCADHNRFAVERLWRRPKV